MSLFHIALTLLISGPILNTISARDSELGGSIEQTISQDPLFVSLGSSCTTAHMHRESGIRKAAFPFDWIISFDGEKLIELLEEDFLHFLDLDFLKVEGQALLNTCYHLEFLNEGDWAEAACDIGEFSLKCQRRIHRFRQLGNYQGKIFFVRTAYPYSVTDPHRIWKFEENIEISPEYAQKLFNTLKHYFPNSDFELVIINGHTQAGFSIEGRPSDRILMARIDGTINSYKNFYSQLRREEEPTTEEF